MTNVVIVSAGTNEIISGAPHLNGPYFPVKYFLLAYDPSFDNTIHSNANLTTDSLPFSATSLTGDTNGVQHSGHLIFNIPGAYTISSEQFLLSGGGIGVGQGYNGTDTISGNAYTSLTDINLLFGNSLVNCFSADALPVATGTVGEWFLEDASTFAVTENISGSKTSPFLATKSNYFQISSYSPIGVAGTDQLRGLFKCRVDNSIGNFKFNKVALYTTTYDESGVETTNPPILVAMAALNEPVRKTTGSGNIANVEIDVECEFNIANTTNTISYLSQDYWIRANNATYAGGTDTVGLYYNGDVVVGTSGDSDWLPSAKFNVTDGLKQQMRLNNIFGHQYVDFNVQNDASMKISTSGSDEMLLTLFKKSGTSVFGNDIQILDYENGDLYNEGKTSLIGQQIIISGGFYTDASEAPTSSKNQYIKLFDKVNGDSIGQEIFGMRTSNFGDVYGCKISISADTTINNTTKNTYGLYVSLASGLTTTTAGYNEKLFAAYFGTGAVQFNDTVYLKGTTTVSGPTVFETGGYILFNTGSFVDTVLPIIGTDGASPEIRFNDSNCYIKRDSNNIIIKNGISNIYLNSNNVRFQSGTIISAGCYLDTDNLSGADNEVDVYSLINEPSIIFQKSQYLTTGTYIYLSTTYTALESIMFNISGSPLYSDDIVCQYDQELPFSPKVFKTGYYEIELSLQNFDVGFSEVAVDVSGTAENFSDSSEISNMVGFVNFNQEKDMNFKFIIKIVTLGLVSDGRNCTYIQTKLKIGSDIDNEKIDGFYMKCKYLGTLR
jgi:hypothetical protein